MIKLTTYNITQFIVQDVPFLLKLKLLRWKTQCGYFSHRSGLSVSVMPWRC